jgi:hypothetical protein
MNGMKSLLTRLGVALTLSGVAGCERDLPFMAPPDQPISGYRLEGYVTDRLGIPIKGLPIGLYYDYNYIDGNPPNRDLIIDDSTKISLVRVLDVNKRVIRVLFRGRTRLGLMDVGWDQKDSLGRSVPSGIYMIDFTLAGVPRNSYTVVVDGAVTAVTDSLGHYSIPNDYLPVGFYPAPLYSNDNTTFLGNFSITPYVVLEFHLQIRRSAAVTLLQDQVTRFDYQI